MTLDEIIEEYFGNLEDQYHVDNYVKWVNELPATKLEHYKYHYFINPYLKQEVKWVKK